VHKFGFVFKQEGLTRSPYVNSIMEPCALNIGIDHLYAVNEHEHGSAFSLRNIVRLNYLEIYSKYTEIIVLNVSD
jgi:hypothetical protein